MARTSPYWANHYDDHWLLIEYANRGRRRKLDRLKARRKDISPELRTQKRKDWNAFMKTVQASGQESSGPKPPISQTRHESILGPKETDDRIAKATGKQAPSILRHKVLHAESTDSRQSSQDQSSTVPPTRIANSRPNRASPSTSPATLDAPTSLLIPGPSPSSLDRKGSDSGHVAIPSGSNSVFPSQTPSRLSLAVARNDSQHSVSRPVIQSPPEQYAYEIAKSFTSGQRSAESMSVATKPIESRPNYSDRCKREVERSSFIKPLGNSEPGSREQKPIDLTEEPDDELGSSLGSGFFGTTGRLPKPDESKNWKGREEKRKKEEQPQDAKQGLGRAKEKGRRQLNDKQTQQKQEAENENQEKETSGKQKEEKLAWQKRQPEHGRGLIEQKPENSFLIPKERSAEDLLTNWRTRDAPPSDHFESQLKPLATQPRVGAFDNADQQDASPKRAEHCLSDPPRRYGAMARTFQQDDSDSDSSKGQSDQPTTSACDGDERRRILGLKCLSATELTASSFCQNEQMQDEQGAWHKELTLPIFDRVSSQGNAEARGMDINRPNSEQRIRLEERPCMNTESAEDTITGTIDFNKDLSSAPSICGAQLPEGSPSPAQNDTSAAEIPSRADGLGNISYYPHFPGSKTSNRHLFTPKESCESSPGTTPVRATSQTISTVNHVGHVTTYMNDQSLFITQEENRPARKVGAEIEGAVGMEKMMGKTQNIRGQKFEGGKAPQMGLSDRSKEQWKQKLDREAEDREERRALLARRESEDIGRRRNAVRRFHQDETPQHSGDDGRTKKALAPGRWPEGRAQGLQPDYSPFANVPPARGDEADPETQQKRAEALFQWRQEGLFYREIIKRWTQLTGRTRGERTLRAYYERLCESIGALGVWNEPKKRSSEPGGLSRFDSEQVISSPHNRPCKRVRFDERPRIREFSRDKSSSHDDEPNARSHPVLEQAEAQRLPIVHGGKNMKLVERLYRERQEEQQTDEQDSIDESSPEEESSAKTARKQSPITDADLTYWAYVVQRKEWSIEEDNEDDTPWTQCGDVYSSLHVANMTAGKEILQQRGAPHPMFPDPDKWEVCKDENGLQNYLVVLDDYCVMVRVDRILRTTRDGIAPDTKVGWLKKAVYEVKYETGESLSQGQQEVRVIPELFTIPGQANREAANKLIDLSVPPKSQRIEDVQKRIESRKQLDGFLVTLDGAKGLFEAEDDEEKGVKVWVEKRYLRGPRNI
ncbi:MAG: hypothetical protein M1821_001581 [Bathelium mastoideum]|nr:MAG: hypothetical protein M1821_001581 [Bathelium mastoideum]